MAKPINEMSVAEYMRPLIDAVSAPKISLESISNADVSFSFQKGLTAYRYIPDTLSVNWENKSTEKDEEKTAWPAFVAILGLFQHLYFDKSGQSSAIYDLLTGVLPAGKLGAWQGAYILPLNKNVYLFDRCMQDAADTAEYDRILQGLDKNCAVEAVLRTIESHVVSRQKSAFREVSLKVFDTDLNQMSPLWLSAYALCAAGNRQIVFTGAPGTGKTYTAKALARAILRAEGVENPEDHIGFVQFHSAYDYSNFVEGLMPVHLPGSKSATFVRMDGTFKNFCRKALEDPDKPYFFIIDEINRADLSRVFGELMYCLDESYRIQTPEDLGTHGVITQYANLRTYIVDQDGNARDMGEDPYHDRFAIPEKVYILATMNDIDRSVEAFDFALRRRFKWLEAKANDEMKMGLLGTLKRSCPDLLERATRLNKTIKDEGKALGLDESYQIGHAYFSSYTGEDSLQRIWDYQIKLILQEYVRGKHNKDLFLSRCEQAFLGN